jgi:peptide/nickel transport system substrate-binding protein
MCTGPFKFVEYVKDQRIVVERNPSYWGDKARVQKMTFRFFPDANTRRLALESGEIDFLMDLPREQVTSTKSRPGLNVTNAPVGRTMLMYLNIHGQEPYVLLQDSAVRHAIGYAIDRPTMFDKVWEGNAAVVLTMGPPEVLGAYAKEVQGYTYDSSRANQLLDAAGWVKGADGVRAKSGKRLSVTLIGWAEWDRQTLEYLQSQLGAVGIEMKIVKSPDQASYTKLLDAGEFDIDLEGPNQNDGNPIFLPALRFYSQASSKNMPFFAPRGRFDQLVEAGSAATDRVTTQQKAAESMHLLIDEEAIVIPVAGLFRIYAMKDSVQGFVPHPSQTNQWWNSVSKTR